jgi:CBS domain-containing protein
MLACAQPGSEPLVAALMSRRPITIARFDPVALAAERLNSCRLRHLPVLDGEALWGLISLRDVLGAPATARVDDLLSRPLATALPTDPVGQACARLVHERRSALPVVDEERLVGLFTATDALRFALTQLDGAAPGPPVGDVMTAPPLATVAASESLARAWALMQAARVRHLPVLAGATLLGLVSDRDLLAVGARPLVVAEAMSPRLATITIDRPAVEAARLLLRRRLGAMPVLRDGALAGIISVTDFLHWIAPRR